MIVSADHDLRQMAGPNISETVPSPGNRYDKLALTYRGGAVLRAINIWPTALGDTP